MLVFIMSPLAGDVEGNLDRVKRICRRVFREGVVPVCSHFYAEVLDDSNPEQRKQGMAAGLELLKVCGEVWVYGDLTAGMREEVEYAKKLNKKIIYK